MAAAQLKVSKSREQILKFPFTPKIEQKYFCISALAYKKRSNQKGSVRESKENPPSSGINCPYVFDLTSFLRLGQKHKNIFVRFLVQMKTLKFAFEIYWPVDFSTQGTVNYLIFSYNRIPN